MDIQRVNGVLVKAIEGLQAGEVEHLWEFSVPSPMDVARRTGMPLPAYKPPSPAAMHAKTGMPLTKKKPGKKAIPKAPVTVDFWLTLLNHKLVQYDMAQSKRERIPNIYRLGHLMGALDLLTKDLKGLGHREDAEALARFRQYAQRRFERDFPPVKSTLKAMDTYSKTGRRPKIGGGTTKPRSTKTAKVGGAPKKTAKKPNVSYWDQRVFIPHGKEVAATLFQYVKDFNPSEHFDMTTLARLAKGDGYSDRQLIKDVLAVFPENNDDESYPSDERKQMKLERALMWLRAAMDDRGV